MKEPVPSGMSSDEVIVRSSPVAPSPADAEPTKGAASSSERGQLIKTNQSTELSKNGHAAAHRQATEAMAEHRVKLTTAEERRTQFQQQRAAQEGELRAASVQHDAAVARLAESRDKRSRHETGLAEMDTRLTGLQQQIARHEVER